MADADFSLLSEPARRRIVALLAERPRRSMGLAETLGLGSAAMARHLRVLREAGIILDSRVARDARVRLYTLNPRCAREVLAWLAVTGASEGPSLAHARWPKHIVVVEFAEVRFAVATDQEPRLVPASEVAAIPFCARDIVGVVNVEGTVVAVVDLAKRLGLERPARTVDDPGCVVVVPSSRGCVGLLASAAVSAGQVRAAEVRGMPPGAISMSAEGVIGLAPVGGRLMALIDPVAFLD
jgi:chemotaxis signal transduction protein/DNA-binding transcriptional ArsR family regulator